MSIGFPDATSSKVESQQPVRTVQTGSTKAPETVSGANDTAGAEVSLSQTGVQALTAQLANVPSIRQERVQSLRQSVQNGTYKPGSQEIAAAIHADLFGTPVTTGA